MFILGERLNSIHFMHELLVNSLLGESLKHFLFSLTLKCNSPSNHWCDFLLSLRNLSGLISISFSNNLSGFSLSLLNDLSFN
jgi:hypothetical protein